MVLKQSFKYTLFNLNSMHFVYAKVREIAQTPTYSIFQSNGFGYEFWDLKPNQKSSILVCFPPSSKRPFAFSEGLFNLGLSLGVHEHVVE